MTKEEFDKLPVLTKKDCVPGTRYAREWLYGIGVYVMGPGHPQSVKDVLSSFDRDLGGKLVSRGARVGDKLTLENAEPGMVISGEWAPHERFTTLRRRNDPDLTGWWVTTDRGRKTWISDKTIEDKAVSIISVPGASVVEEPAKIEVESMEIKSRKLRLTWSVSLWDGIPSRDEPDRRPGHCERHNTLCCPRCDTLQYMTVAEIRAMVGPETQPVKEK